MRKLKFELKENSRAGKVYIQVEYCGGDADIEIYEDYCIENTTFESPETFVKTPELIKEIDFFDRLYAYLDQYADEYSVDEGIAIDEHGKDVYQFVCEYGGVPSDATTNFQFNCRIGRIVLITYDLKGNKYSSYL